MVFRAKSKVCRNIESFWKSQGLMTFDGLSQRAPRLVRARPPHGSDLVVKRRTDTVFRALYEFGWNGGIAVLDGRQPPWGTCGPLRLAAPPCGSAAGSSIFDFVLKGVLGRFFEYFSKHPYSGRSWQKYTFLKESTKFNHRSGSKWFWTTVIFQFLPLQKLRQGNELPPLTSA